MELATFAEQTSHYAAVRARLMGTVKPTKVRHLTPAPKSLEPAKKRTKEEVHRDRLARRRAQKVQMALAKFKPVSVFNAQELPKCTVDAHFAWEGGPEVLPIPVPRWKQIVIEVAEREKILIGDLMVDNREKHVVAARGEIFYRMRHECGLSYPEIGKRMGNRDHSTVIWGVKRHAQTIGGKSPQAQTG